MMLNCNLLQPKVLGKHKDSEKLMAFERPDGKKEKRTEKVKVRQRLISKHVLFLTWCRKEIQRFQQHLEDWHLKVELREIQSFIKLLICITSPVEINTVEGWSSMLNKILTFLLFPS